MFEPIKIGGVTMRNRIAMCPMTTCFADPEGMVTDRMVAFLGARARGGVGMVFTEGAAVHPLACGWVHQFAAWDARQQPGLARLASAIRGHGAVACLQLMHNGRRAFSAVSGGQPLAPSAIPAEGSSWEQPRAMTALELEEHLDSFVDATVRAADAGWDAVELHGAHGYLINQFLSPLSNHRDDAYGGDLERRARFPVEIIRRVHSKLGPDFPVGIRISLFEVTPGGITVADSERLVEILEAAGAAWVDGSAGVSSLTRELRWTIGTGEATLAPEAAQVRAHLSRIPYMLVGRVIHPITAERVLADGIADIVGVGRALIADPDWVAKAAAGGDITICIGCQACQMRSEHRDSGCPVNVRVGHEFEYRPQPTNRSRKILVLDSGVGGLEAALIAAERGHEVSIANVRLPFGGMLGLRARVPGNEEIGETLANFRRRVEASGIAMRDFDDVDAARSWATAEVETDCLPPDELGLELPWHTVGLISAFLEPDELSGRIAVVGDGLAAAETALFLSGLGKEVTILTTQRRPARDTHPQVSYRVLERFAAFGGKVRSELDFGKLDALAQDFDAAVRVLGWRDPVEGAVSDTWNPWEQRFVAERGMAVGLAL
jgi:2,4-dienoyl-CoA reductase-like NADH-dependent reductase (Old Yellow Enzyme family)